MSERSELQVTASETPGSEAPTARRRGGRRGGAHGTGQDLPEQRPWGQPTMRLRPTEVVSEDELEAIHLASLHILRDTGIDFLDPESRDLLRAAGADVDPDSARVRFDPDFVTERIATAPESFRLHSWNPDRTLTIGGDHLAFGSVGSPPNYVDLDGNRRPGTRADLPGPAEAVPGDEHRALRRRLPRRADRRRTPPSATCTPRSTCSRSPTSPSTRTASGASGTGTSWSWRASPAASTTPPWSVSPRCSRS